MRALEFYSGIGGLHVALKRSKMDAAVVQAFDWDQTACQVYSLNYGPDIISKVDISTLKPDYLANFNADIWLLSPACQPYTVLNSNAKGASDPRAQSFLHLIQDVLPKMKMARTNPSYILVENVAGFETSSTRILLCSTLRSLGYATLELLLSPIQFGIPNSRLRYYLLAKREPLQFTHEVNVCEKVWESIPEKPDRGRAQEQALPESSDPNSALALREIRWYLEHDLSDSQPYHIPDKVLEKWGRLFDIVLPSSKRSCCFTRGKRDEDVKSHVERMSGYTHLVERAGSILQMNEELDTTQVFDNFLAAQKAGSVNAVQILRPLKLRYFTPSELLRLFDFEPPSHYDTKFSVNIRVVTALLDYMRDI